MLGISKAVYLVDDNEHPYSGWTFDSRGLAADKRNVYAEYDFEKIYPEYDTYMRRSFRKADEGRICLEANFLTDCESGFSIKMYATDGNEALGVVTDNGFFKVLHESVTGISLITDGKNSIKADISLDEKSYKLYINNIFAGEYKMPDGVCDLSSLSMGIDSGYTGKVGLRSVRLYKDFLVNEKMLSPFDTLPCDIKGEADNGEIYVKNSPDCTFSLEYTRYLVMKAVDGKASISKVFDAVSGKLCFECKFLLTDISGKASFALGKYQIKASDGILYFDRSKACAFKENLWNTLRLEFYENTIHLRLNGKLKKEFSYSGDTTFDNLEIVVLQGEMHLDDISVFEILDLPSDYVPKPKSSKNKGYHVGMNVCSLWRSGFWRGRHDAMWDVVAPFDEITPIMGFYDEGIPEVADWETKMLSENGVDFQFLCWYGPRNICEPIKFTGFSFALHDGYFNSVYKSDMKFAIMWENGFTGRITSEGFRKYLVPYFMEYYFKDECYYKIDNKPVFSVFMVGQLVNYFGGIEEARTELEYLRQAEQLREVFGEEYTLETNIFPTEKQKKRIGILYPENHAMLRPLRWLEKKKTPFVLPEIKETVQVFDFSDSKECDKWVYANGACGKKLVNGAMCGHAEGFNPHLIRHNLNIDVSKANYLRLRLKSLDKKDRPTLDSKFMMYYKTDDMKDFIGSLCAVSTEYTEDENGIGSVCFNLSNTTFKDGINYSLRLDMMRKWELYSMELLLCDKEQPSTSNGIFIDGVKMNDDLPFMVIGNEAYVPLYVKSGIIGSLNAAYSWDRKKGELVLTIGKSNMIFVEGSDKCICDGKTVKLPEKVFLTDGVPTIPIKTLCDISGYECEISEKSMEQG